MIEAIHGKALRDNRHAFETEFSKQRSIGRGRKIALPREVENVEDEDILPFQSVNVRLDAVSENLPLQGEIASRPGVAGANPLPLRDQLP